VINKKEGASCITTHLHLFGKHQGLFAAWECAKTKPTYPIVSCRGEVRSPENSLLCVFGQANPAPTNETTALSTF
jgi:hypothetical protein